MQHNKAKKPTQKSSKNKYKIEYFNAEPEKEVNMKASAVIGHSIHNEFKDFLHAFV